MRGLVLILLVACGGRDTTSLLDDKESGGGTLTTIAPTRTMGELSTNETKQLCEDFKAFQKRSKPSDDEGLRMTCQAQAAVQTLAGSGDDASLRAACKKELDACIARKDKPQEPELDCSNPEFLGQMGVCKELTVGEISACVQDLAGVMKKLAATDLCGTLTITPGKPPTDEILSKVKSEKCAVLETKCADKPGAGHGSASPDLEQKTLAALSDFKGKMCACKDKACADSVRQQMNTWGEQLASKHPEFRPSPDTAKRLAEITNDYMNCMLKLAGDNSGGSGSGSAQR